MLGEEREQARRHMTIWTTEWENVAFQSPRELFQLIAKSPVLEPTKPGLE